MAEYGLSSQNRKPPNSSLFTPRLFTSSSIPKAMVIDSESLMSPTSILDSKPFCAFRNPFWSDPNTPKTPKPESKNHWEKLELRGGVGLGLVDALTDEKSEPKPDSPMLLFGSQFKIQALPPLPVNVNSPVDSPKSSPVDFGIKTKNNSSQMGLFLSPVSSPISPVKKSPFGSSNSGLESSNSPPRDFSSLSISEMELSEEYTRVITHGPNPKTTHIFDDCVVERCFGSNLGGGPSLSDKENSFLIEESHPMIIYPSDNFLSFCYNCKKKLGQGKDIYMYRGEKAFCSIDCRLKEMMIEEEMEEIPQE
ncbi:hypothetical protein M9H77_35187 [Catharanthus roseus]|uniref:Uncharacterized protein n=1 Tax=Catharanthus roseus TaxID=4058 RepID=A0ACB9ZQF8_CATRO|nr:hypothetical protein M9H77_35187 [Catharanthus roseus]